jgi:catechol 2,3-dioxygenase-like lactoylglutathione lyase family enzyme
LAVFALDLEATARFYTEVMGMPVTGVTTNRDEPRSTHMNVDIGNGVSISFFDFPHVERLKVPVPEGVGGMMHVAIPVSPERRDEIEGRLKDHGMEYGDVGGSLYVKDPNGMTMELLSP